MNIKEQYLKGYNENIARYKETLAIASSILGNLEKWDKKMVNVAFNKKYYTINNGYKNVILHEVKKPYYTWASHNLEMYISRDVTLELENRETSHIIEVLKEKIEHVKTWIENNERDIKKLSEFDIEQFNKDIKELYKKHNEPKNWKDLLDEVKYI